VYGVQAALGENNIAAATNTQVVSVCIYGGDSQDFQNYGGGVFDADCGSRSEGHCIAVPPARVELAIS
jgi:hypothetical protein